MCETKAVLAWLSLILLVAASFCIFQAHTENKVRHQSKIKTQGASENQYKKHCMNSGEFSYLIDEGFAICNCTWLNGGKRCERYSWCN